MPPAGYVVLAAKPNECWEDDDMFFSYGGRWMPNTHRVGAPIICKHTCKGSGLFARKFVQVPLARFYPAEGYHQDYLKKNPNGYTCHYLRD